MSKPQQVEKPTKNLTSKINYKAYYDAGYIVCPEKNGIPIAGFSFSNPIYDPTWERLDSSWGIGIITGSKSNLTIVDIDEATPEELERIVKLLPHTPVKKFGSKGLNLFFAHNGESNPTFKKDDRLLVEIMGNNRKSTLPPSLHRETEKEYIWIEEELLDATLPVLPTDIVELLNSVLNILTPKPISSDYPKADYEYPDDYNEAVKALEFCNYNAPYLEWITILLSWKKRYDVNGFDAINSWSSKGKTYPGTNKLWQIWRKLSPHSVTIGTMFYYAYQGGYRAPERISITHNSIDPIEYTKLKLIEEVRKIEEAEGMPDIISNAPPLIKEFCSWIYSTAYYSQPMLSLGAALATIGFLMGRDFACANSGIRANLYNICIAGTQENKEHVKERCQQVMKEFGLLKNYRTAWTSGSAIENTLQQTDGQILYITDEMGIMMNSLVGKYTNANQQEAVSIILRLYTEKYYKGKDYAASAEKKAVEIDNPFVSICGFTQREPFFEAMSSMQTFTGVLNRMCLFKAPDIRPLRNKKYNIEQLRTIPTALKDKLEELRDSIEYLKVGKKHTSVTKYVSYTEDAIALLEKIKDETDQRFRRSQIDGETIHLLIGRNPEVIEKVALIASGGKIITKEILEWAKAVVDYSTGIMCESSRNIVDNEFERQKIKFIEYLEKKGGFASKTEISQGCAFFKTGHEKFQVIQELKDAERIELQSRPSLAPGRKGINGYGLIKD